MRAWTGSRWKRSGGHCSHCANPWPLEGSLDQRLALHKGNEGRDSRQVAHPRGRGTVQFRGLIRGAGGKVRLDLQVIGADFHDALDESKLESVHHGQHDGQRHHADGDPQDGKKRGSVPRPTPARMEISKGKKQREGDSSRVGSSRAESCRSTRLLHAGACRRR